MAAAFAALHVGIYGLLIRPPAYPWYYVAPYYVAALLTSVAVAEVATRVVGRFQRVPRGAAAALAAFAVVAYGVLCRPYLYPTDPYSGYRSTGRWLAVETSANATVSATEIGVLGWTSDRTIVDHLGLLDRRTADEFARRDVTSWFLRERPDYVVVHVPLWEFEEPALRTDDFVRSYRPVHESGYGDGPGDYHWSHVRVYERVARADVDASGAAHAVRFLDAVDAAGIELDDDERAALVGVVVDLIGSRSRQQELDRRPGVDVAELVASYRAEPPSDGVDDAALARLARRLDGVRIVVTVAPRASEGVR